MRIISLVALLLLTVLQPALVRGADADVVRVGVSNTDAAAQPLYSQETGIFRRLGIDARITGGMQGGPIIDAIKAGTIDVGFANIVSIATAIQNGDPVVLLAAGSVYDTRGPLTVIVQTPDSPLRSGKDLNGKTIEVPSARKDLATMATMAWIDQHGGDSSTVKFVAGIPLEQIAEALKAGKVDASELTEPHLSVQKRAGTVRVLAPTYDAIAPHFLIGGWVASKKWVDAQPDAARRFAQAMRESARWGNTHQTQSAPLLAKELKVDPSIVLGMVRSEYGESLQAGLIQPCIDVAVRYGAMKPMNAAEMLKAQPAASR
jgi:NitT/TauT family transport system substrate-binding protein